MARKRIALLGSTGSIGRQALDVISCQPDTLQVCALAAGSPSRTLIKQSQTYRPQWVAWTREIPVPEAFGDLDTVAGPDALVAVIERSRPDLVLLAVSGVVGLPAALRAAELGIDLAIANKEPLVVAGALLRQAAARTGSAIIPVDSEHSAVAQCLRAGRQDEVRRATLTASGGPFRGWNRENLSSVTVGEALAHPTWDMGPKITVDSATLMNKALEVIEAHILFDLPMDRIEVVVHPESVVHSLVEFHDGSTIAHLGPPDMRIPIQYALSTPRRWPRESTPFSLAAVQALHFEEPDHETFPSIELARQAAASGGTATTVLNAANEVAVQRFLAGQLAFVQIFELVRTALDDHIPEPIQGLEQILEVDRRVRQNLNRES